ncbi:MAG: putative transport protein [Cyclobacteriaceae bacterium]|jgi:predicted transport protein
MDPQLQTMIDNMPAKTGKSLTQWLSILSGHTFSKHSDIVNYLKGTHDVTYGFANTIAHLSKDQVSDSADLVKLQYEGKGALKDIYQRLIEILDLIGDEVEVAPKKTYVSLRRKKQFALIQTTTKTRVDLGINLKGYDSTGKLEPSGSFSSMVSHRVRLSEVSDIDQQVIDWLKQAYEQAQ